MPTLSSLAERLHRLRSLVGFARFNLIGLDEGLTLARNYPRVGEFSAAELKLLDEFFAADPVHWGFHGSRVTSDISREIPQNEVVKIRGSGHYLYRGEAQSLFKRLRRDIGTQLHLASGVRNVLKQAQLFCDKLIACEGDFRQTTRWVAPPGHSFHAAGDFDLGLPELGSGNLTEAFADTDAFHKLSRLNYAELRYPRENPYGVAFEPWHIRVV